MTTLWFGPEFVAFSHLQTTKVSVAARSLPKLRITERFLRPCNFMKNLYAFALLIERRAELVAADVQFAKVGKNRSAYLLPGYEKLRG